MTAEMILNLATIIIIFIMMIMIFIEMINLRPKKKEKSPLNGAEFDSLLNILMGIIELEINLYETNIFKDREGITNANFDNYYKDMCESIRDNISDEYMNEMTRYVKEEFVYTLIARKIKFYLASKVV